MKVISSEDDSIESRENYRRYRGVLGRDWEVITEFQCFSTFIDQL